MEDVNLKKVFNEIVDVDHLVELVRARPVIWDKSVEGYRNRDVSLPAWHEIYNIIFPGYDVLSVDQQKFVGKIIKDKWTTVRDIWQRTYRKRKEALKKGENINDMKENARYENLKFLAKVYDKDDHFWQDKDDCKVENLAEGNGAHPQSPSFNPDEENIFNHQPTDFQRNCLNVLMNKKSSQQNSLNVSSKKRKLENEHIKNAQEKKGQGNKLARPFVINIDENLKSNIPKAARKLLRTSSLDNGGTESSSDRNQPLKHDKSNIIKQESLGSANNQPTNNSCVQMPRKISVKTPSQMIKTESPCTPSTSISNNPKSEPVEGLGQVSCTTDEPQAQRKKPSMGSDSTTDEVDNFFQILRPRIEDFDKSQILNFFFEILRPRIKDFDKHQMLDFQIEALQLLKKVEGNRAS